MTKSKSWKQRLRIALAGFAFIGFGFGAGLLSWIALPLASCDPNEARRRRRCQRMIRTTFVWFHDYMRLVGLVEYDPRRLVHPPRLGGARLIVTNHPTLVDVSALVAAFGELCFVAKSSLFRNPLIGPLLRLGGHIEAGGSFGNAATLEQVVTRLREGHDVLMFPEGTRSPWNGLNRFRSGAFSAAVEANVPVVPVAIEAAPPGLKRGQAWHEIPTQPIVLKVEVLEPIAAGAYGDAHSLRDAARQRIEQALEQIAITPSAPAG